MLTLEQAGSALNVSAEFIRRRIVKGQIKARFAAGSPKLGYIIERTEYVRWLRSVGEDRLADQVESGGFPEKSA